MFAISYNTLLVVRPPQQVSKNCYKQFISGLCITKPRFVYGYSAYLMIGNICSL